MKQFKKILAIAGLACCLTGVTACTSNRADGKETTPTTDNGAVSDDATNGLTGDNGNNVSGVDGNNATENGTGLGTSDGNDATNETDLNSDNMGADTTEETTKGKVTDGDKGVLDEAGDAVRDAVDGDGTDGGSTVE